MFRRPLFREIRNRQAVLKDTTVRDFSGGWNVIDNDLNLDPRFAKVLTNLYRRPDGSLGLRYGTQLFGDISDTGQQRGLLSDDGVTFATSYTGDITASTVDTTAVVTISLEETNAEHNLVVGQVVNIAAGFSVGGLAAGDWDGDRTVTSVPSSNEFTIVADANATSTVTSSATEETIAQKDTDVAASTDVIIGTEYFQDHIIIVTDQGEVWSMDSLGEFAPIWSTAIAAAQAGSPTGWSTGLTFASFAVKNSRLTIHNGIDKPLEVNLDATNGVKCQYVVDAASGANTNTPIGRYAVAADRYLVIAGDPTEPDAIHISNIDTYGTFLGDGAPNDAVKIRMSQRVPTKSPTIRGIGWFRDQLIVGFDDGVAFLQLGNYTDDATPLHIPSVVDFIENIGCHAHKSMQSIGDDFFMADHIGVPSVQRALFTGGVRAERVSQLIDPEIQSAIAALTVGQTEDGVFALFNPTDNQYMLFVPNAAETARDVFVYTVIRTLKVAAWSKFEGWNFAGGCVSLLGRVFLYEGTYLYLYDTPNSALPIHTDYTNIAYGVRLDNINQRATRASALDGVTDGTSVWFVALLRPISPDAGFDKYIISGSQPPSGINIRIEDGISANQRITVDIRAGGVSYSLTSDDFNLYDGEWHAIFFAIDYSGGTATVHMYIDSTEVYRFADPVLPSGPQTIDLTLTSWNVAGLSSANSSIESDVAAVFMGTGTPNFSSATIRSRWVLPSGTLADVGSTGAKTLFPPAIFMRGGASDWGTNYGSGGAFTVSVQPTVDVLLEQNSTKHIDFEWELPWGDFDRRTATKMLEYLKLETTGTASFTLDTYVDNITSAPHLSMEFAGGDAATGRVTSDERLWKWPVKGNIFKHIIHGSASEDIRFVSLSFLYRVGSIRR